MVEASRNTNLIEYRLFAVKKSAFTFSHSRREREDRDLRQLGRDSTTLGDYTVAIAAKQSGHMQRVEPQTTQLIESPTKLQQRRSSAWEERWSQDGDY